MWLLQVSVCMYSMLKDRLVWNLKLVFILFTTFSEKGVTHLSGVIAAFSSTQLFLQREKAQMKPRYCQVTCRSPCQNGCASVFVELGCHQQDSTQISTLWSIARQKIYVSPGIFSSLIFLKADICVSVFTNLSEALPVSSVFAVDASLSNLPDYSRKCLM